MARSAADSLEDFFKAFPALLGRTATPTERNAFGRYANLLVLWNRTHHLTALKTRADIARVLFLDSLLWRSLLPREPLRILDIGAGAGVPGIPLRMVDHSIALTLIESRRKPVSFLHALIRDLKFDFVLTRAVGRGSRVIEMAAPYLRPGGKVIASGPPVSKAMPKVEWPNAEWKKVEFPGLGLPRAFLVATIQD